jgi:phosphoribosylformylglycinamidine synthase
MTRLGLAGLEDVRQGKQFVLTIDGELDAEQLAAIDHLAQTLLSNPVIEDYRVTVSS